MATLTVYGPEAVHAALSWSALADALHAAFVAGDAQVPLRHAHALDATGSAGQGEGTLLLMPAWSGAAIGLKLVTVIPGASAHGAGTVQASYLLLDRETGVARALIDGEALTLRRTAATSALAARWLARADAKRLLIVGTGRLAPWMVRAHAALRPGLERIEIWGRDAAKARALAALLREQDGLNASPADDLRAAVAVADIVCCATTSRQPIVRGAWLREGTHLDLVGGFRRDMREADDAAVARSRIVVDTFAGALAEAGDLLQPIEHGVIARGAVDTELAQLLRQERRGRLAAADITLFKSVGAALEDLAAAQLVVATAP